MILSVEFLFKNQRTLIKKTQDKINNQMARVSFGFTKHFLFPFPFLQTITNKSYHPLFTGFQSFEPKQSENTFKFANMMAGHSSVKILSGSAWTMIVLGNRDITSASSSSSSSSSSESESEHDV